MLSLWAIGILFVELSQCSIDELSGGGGVRDDVSIAKPNHLRVTTFIWYTA